VDVEVTSAEPSKIPDEAPVGTVPAIRDPDLGGYTLAEDEAGYIIRLYGLPSEADLASRLLRRMGLSPSGLRRAS
jgi:hypothetical protein